MRNITLYSACMWLTEQDVGRLKLHNLFYINRCSIPASLEMVLNERSFSLHVGPKIRAQHSAFWWGVCMFLIEIAALCH